MKVNWSRCALDLRSAGLALAAVDRRIGEWKGFTASVANGEIQEPKFSQGIELLNLHESLCGADKTRELLA